MKQLWQFFSFLLAAVLFSWSVQAQTPERNRPLDPLPLQEKIEDGNEPVQENDKWNAEGRLFLSLYAQGQTKSSKLAKGKKMVKRLQVDFGMQRISENKSTRDYLPVFLEYNGEDALLQAEALGFKVQTKLSGICTGLLPVDAAAQIADIAGVVRISASLPNEVHNDKSRTANKVPGVQENYATNGLKQAYDGTGVLLGIIDLGFDYTHPTFYTTPSNKSTYRVKKVWDQSATGTKPSGYTYGAEYSGTDAILAAAHDQDDGTHATHVAGTAGGSGAGTAYKGMAPGADFIFVATNMYNSGIFDGISYIEKYAAAQDKPCVVNMSLGSNIGPHDGTDAFDKACDQIARKGFILVGSAGNSGDTKLHYQAGVVTGKPASAYLDMDAKKDFYIDCWSNNKKHFVAFVAVMQDGESIGYISYNTSNSSGGKKEIKSGSTVLATVNADCETNVNNGQPHILMSLDASSADAKGYDIMIQFQAVDDSVGIHAWLSSGEFDRGDVNYTHNATISAGNSVLSVAAYNTRVTWKNSAGDGYRYTAIGEENDISSFSSRGPLVNGVNKPDIAAPGAGIVSAGNSYNADNIAESRLIANTTVSGKTYPWVLEQGTSMSSPAMAGIVALFLQKDPTLDIIGLKEILSKTAINDTYTGQSARVNPNPTWGYGKVDALAGLKYMEAKDAPPVEQVTVTIAQTTGGTVEVELEDGTAVNSGDKVGKGTVLWMLADADKDHRFVSWWDGDTEELREYEVEANVTISAIFEKKEDPIIPIEKVKVSIAQTTGGTVSVKYGQETLASGDSLPLGSELSLRAEADEAYRFVAWWDGDKNLFRTYILNEEVSISATFEEITVPEPETATVRILQSQGGTIQVLRGQETIESGSKLPLSTALTLKASPKEGYYFDSWWDGNENTLRSYVIKEDVTISADFVKMLAVETEAEDILRIYPNPTEGYVTLESPVSARVEVLTSAGTRLCELAVEKGVSCQLDLSGEPAGIYFLRLDCKDKVSVFKVMRR